MHKTDFLYSVTMFVKTFNITVQVTNYTICNI